MERKKVPQLENTGPRFPFFIYQTGKIGAVKEHDHDFFEIVYIYKGNGVCSVGGRQYPFRSNQLVFTPEFVPHAFKSSEGGVHQQVSVAVHGDMLGHVRIKRFRPQAVLDRIRNLQKYILEVPPGSVRDIENLFKTLYLEYSFKAPGWESIISLELMRLFALVDRFARGGAGTVARIRAEDPRVFMVLRNMESDYYSASCLKRSMEKIQVNRRYFIRLFKQEAGYPPLNYLNRLRIEKACELLAHTNHPVIQIAYDVGCTNLSYFNRLFNKYLGASPTRFRSRIHGAPRPALPARFDFPLNRR